METMLLLGYQIWIKDDKLYFLTIYADGMLHPCGDETSYVFRKAEFGGLCERKMSMSM